MTKLLGMLHWVSDLGTLVDSRDGYITFFHFLLFPHRNLPDILMAEGVYRVALACCDWSGDVNPLV